MEQQRMYVLEWTDRIRNIPFSTPPASYCDPKMVVIKKGMTDKRTAKLNPAKVQEIRTALQAGEPIADIAARYRVSVVAIAQLRDGRTWSEVE